MVQDVLMVLMIDPYVPSWAGKFAAVAVAEHFVVCYKVLAGIYPETWVI